MTEFNLTEWSSDKATLFRIDRLLIQCEKVSFEEDIKSYFKVLRNLRKEAIVKMKHQKKSFKCVVDCQKCMDEEMWDKLRNEMKAYELASKDINYKSYLLYCMENYEISIRDFMNEKGMLLREKYDEGL